MMLKANDRYGIVNNEHETFTNSRNVFFCIESKMNKQ